MSGWSWAHPDRLPWVAAAAALALGLVLLDRLRRRAVLARLGDAGVLAPMLASSAPGRQLARQASIVVAVVLLALAAAGPRRDGVVMQQDRGLDLVIALDVSKSMLVTDVAPDRLARARELALQTLDALPGDRSAAAVFAADAAAFPLSRDHEVTAHFLTTIGPADVAPGSNLAQALRAARCLLRPDVVDAPGCKGVTRHGRGGDPLPGDRDDVRPPLEPAYRELEERGRAIVLFTDGAERPELAEAEVSVIRALGISLFVVGVGTVDGGEVWDIDDDGHRTRPKKDARGQPVISRRDDLG
ncbi:MAG: VWA domain-containing protein [Kofleriaceae bacterium]